MTKRSRQVIIALLLAAACTPPAIEHARRVIDGAYLTDTTCYPLLWQFEGARENPAPGLERPTFERRGDTIHPPAQLR